MRDVGKFPSEFLNAESITEWCKDKVLFAWSNSAGTTPLHWQVLKRRDLQDTWAEIQNDFESSHGSAAPRDCVFGFELLAQVPLWPKGRRVEGIQKKLELQYGTATCPPLASIRKLERKDLCANAPLIILVRLPRPVGAKNVVPFGRRKDVEKIRAEKQDGSSDAFLSQLFAKTLLEQHPCDAQAWHITNHGTVLCPPNKSYVCSRCGAQGHHYSSAHDDVQMHYTESLPSSKVWFECMIPSWQPVEPLPREDLRLAEVLQTMDVEEEEEGKRGFQVQVRNTSAQVPLRLARHLKLRGATVVGQVPVCGVKSLQA